ncbi:MAG: hybrid sensor histidine kinase/response regulator [Verrucomicrobiota bacterium]
MPSEAPQKEADILVVDDQRDNLQLLQEQLVTRGYHVRPVSSGRDALNAARRKRPDLILLDLIMPEMDGHAVIHALMSDPNLRSIPVIVVSCANDPGVQVKAIQAGAVDYVSRPFKIDEIDARIQNQLRLQQMQVKLNDQNQQLTAALEKAEKLENRRDQLTHMLAYHLNSPLSAVMFGLRMALNYCKDTEANDVTIEMIDEGILQAGRMSESIRQLLAIRELEEAELPVNPVSGDMIDVIREATMNAAVDPLRVEFDDTQSFPAKFDPEVIRPAIAHLISRAAHTSPKEAPIQIEANLDDQFVRVCVRDCGKPIPKSHQNKVWRMFWQIKGTADHFEPTPDSGLGLTYCQLAVEAHGGAVGLDTLKTGNEFWFVLPVNGADAETLPIAA